MNSKLNVDIDVDKWAKLAGVDELPPDQLEQDLLDVVPVKCDGYLWAVSTSTETSYVITAKRDVASLVKELKDGRGVQNVNYIGEVSGQANVDGALLSKSSSSGNEQNEMKVAIKVSAEDIEAALEARKSRAYEEHLTTVTAISPDSVCPNCSMFAHSGSCMGVP